MTILDELKAAKKASMDCAQTLNDAYNLGFFDAVTVLNDLYEHQHSIEEFEYLLGKIFNYSEDNL